MSDRNLAELRRAADAEPENHCLRRAVSLAEVRLGLKGRPFALCVACMNSGGYEAPFAIDSGWQIIEGLRPISVISIRDINTRDRKRWPMFVWIKESALVREVLGIEETDG